MWAKLLSVLITAATTLAGSAIMRVFTRFSIYFGMVYGSELIFGDNPAKSLIDMALHPDSLMIEAGNAAFGIDGTPGWPSFIVYLTDVWSALSMFVYAAASWFIVKQFLKFGRRS